ncbi:MAG: hypothetical protein LBH96_03810 [Candidatus Peribacteria bacterium]|nr:hypothetical protein [Candidatus Peribacteria bacterium]
MKHTSLLHSPVFPDTPHFVAFKELLSTLDHTTPQQISREAYTALSGNILEPT